MNYVFAKEVGPLRYVWRRCLWKLLQTLDGRPSDYPLPTGLRLPFPRGNFFASDVFVTQGSVDWNAEHILARYLMEHPGGRQGDFLDVGSHIGYYALLLAPLVRQVYAFEPDPRNREAMARTAARAANVEVVEKAVADQDGLVGFCEGEASSVSHLADKAEDAQQSVEAVTLDRFVDERQLRPLAVKVDIEGFDILALEGARRTARQHRPVFLVEFNLEDERPNSHERLGTFLDEVGYELLAIVRTEAGPFRCEYEFKKLSASEVAAAHTKMLFLVPAGNRWFAVCMQRRPRWSSLELRPAGVARVLTENVQPSNPEA
ncbi:FkbM family methyltransferase [Verrucomicrobium sp. BvORR106]|uniref:FkbM family methyltransferase n=1 Tax=Verrucomicrobium sp. BvORR106 TaxID=1403819 RepID=UPI00056EEBA1|nr:FkbM family methyltransferase [Verrucomicrobium sp. BvORR106]